MATFKDGVMKSLSFVPVKMSILFLYLYPFLNLMTTFNFGSCHHGVIHLVHMSCFSPKY